MKVVEHSEFCDLFSWTIIREYVIIITYTEDRRGSKERNVARQLPVEAYVERPARGAYWQGEKHTFSILFTIKVRVTRLRKDEFFVF